MTCEESIKWLKNLYNELGQSQYQGLWPPDSVFGLSGY